MNDKTLIQVSIELRDYLKTQRTIPREPYDSVIKRLIDAKEDLENGSEPRS